jgi:hypothetical protein
MRWKSLFTTAAVCLGAPALAGAAPIVVDGPTTGWTPVLYTSVTPDFGDDQRTGIPEADIVGDLSHAAFYTAFDDAGAGSLTDGILGFRIRIGSEKNPAGFSQVAVVGIDANLDGALDLFVLVDHSGSNRIRIYNAGAGANTSPSTTTISATGFTYIEDAANFDWSIVDATIDPAATDFDVDNDGDTDFFVSFTVPFQDVATQLGTLGIAGVDQNTPLRYVVGTSTQPNALNQDLGGPNGGTSSTTSWTALGAMSIATGAAGAVPEPATASMLALGLLGLAFCGRRRR